MAAAKKLGIATLPHRLSHGDDHRHCLGLRDSLADFLHGTAKISALL